MLKIRLMRIGAKGRPFYRIVVVDERKKRTGSYIDLIGTYNPLSNPKEIKIDQAKVDEWTKKGAQMSTGFLRITGNAPKKLEGKVKNPGKLRSNTPAKEEAPVEEAPAADETAEPVQDQEAEDVPTETTEETVAQTPEVTEDAPVAGEEEAAQEESSEEEKNA